MLQKRVEQVGTILILRYKFQWSSRFFWLSYYYGSVDIEFFVFFSSIFSFFLLCFVVSLGKKGKGP